MNEIVNRSRLYFYISLPAIASVVLLIFSTVNYKIPGAASFVPLFAAMSVFYWVIYAPNFMPKWFVFMLGIFQDMLYGTPIGISSLINIILWTAIFSQRRILVRETFMVIWGIFIITCTAICAAVWILNSLIFGHFALYGTVIMQWAISITVYPIVHRIFSAVFAAILRNF